MLFSPTIILQATAGAGIRSRTTWLGFLLWVSDIWQTHGRALVNMFLILRVRDRDQIFALALLITNLNYKESHSLYNNFNLK